MGYQNFFATRLANDIGASDTTITVEIAPTETSGRLVLEARNPTKREIIRYTGVSGNDLTGVLRGQGGTSATTHTKNSLVEMNLTAEDLEDALEVNSQLSKYFDDNFTDGVVPGGCLWTALTGLNGSMTEGVVYINGIRIKADAIASRTFAASSDTYVFIDVNGDPVYDAEVNGAARPATPADTVFVAKIVTDGSSITSISMEGVDRVVLAGAAGSGWDRLPANLSVSSGYNKGNKSFVLDSDEDLTTLLSPGMRLKVDRSIGAPTQCTDLEASSSQYASRPSANVSGITFTDDFTVEAWVKLDTYSSSSVLERRVSGSNGWLFQIMGTGQIRLQGLGTSGNPNEHIESYQSVPLNKWTHIAASLDMSGNTGKVYIDGVEVPSTFTSVAAGSALVNSGDLRLGTRQGTDFFDGKISDVRLWSTIRTGDQIRDNMNQQLVGNETNLVGYWKLNGDFSDSTSNANHLTAQASAGFVTDNPMKNTEYAIITSVTDTQLTVFTGTDHNIPNMTLVSPFYSTQGTPFGFPRGADKWLVSTVIKSAISQSSPNPTSYYFGDKVLLNVPTGSWKLGFTGVFNSTKGSAGEVGGTVALSTSASSATNNKMRAFIYSGLSNTNIHFPFNFSDSVYIESATDYMGVATPNAIGSLSSISFQGQRADTVITAECAYL